MSEFDERIKGILGSRQSRDAQLLELLEAPDDITTIVLRGHLAIEELLFAAVSAHCVDAQHLKDAKLRFPQLACLLRALDKLPSVPPKYWRAISEINSLRNSLAHALEPSDVSDRVSKFIASLELPDEMPKSQDPREQLKLAIHFLIGGLSAITAFQDALEELILHRLHATPDGP